MKANRTDSNQTGIVEYMRDRGAAVWVAHQVKGGFPDLIVLWGGKILLVEVKNKGGKLTPAQIKFFELFRGYCFIVESIEDARNLLDDNARFV